MKIKRIIQYLAAVSLTTIAGILLLSYAGSHGTEYLLIPLSIPIFLTWGFSSIHESNLITLANCLVNCIVFLPILLGSKIKFIDRNIVYIQIAVLVVFILVSLAFFAYLMGLASV